MSGRYWAVVNHKARKAFVFYGSEGFVRENRDMLITLFNWNLWCKDVDYSDTEIVDLGEDWSEFLVDHVGYKIVTLF